MMLCYGAPSTPVSAVFASRWPRVSASERHSIVIIFISIDYNNVLSTHRGARRRGGGTVIIARSIVIILISIVTIALSIDYNNVLNTHRGARRRGGGNHIIV
jgi:hypothetical protein